MSVVLMAMLTVLIPLAGGVALALLVTRAIERALMRGKIDELHRYRHKRAHVRFMKARRERRERYRAKPKSEGV